MGACCSTTFNTDPTSRHIDSKMSEEERYENSLHKLLFLGPGGSGKSTIFRQLQWLHGGGMADEDRLKFKVLIDFQIIHQMQDAITYYLSDIAQDEALQNAINRVQLYPREAILTSESANDIKYIWQNDIRLKNIFDIHHTTKVLSESTEYFWNNIDRIAVEDYMPTKQDIIHVRNMTTGIVQKQFSIKKINLHIFDVGGQKSERKKWFRCFDGVYAIVFVVAISSYNETMYEDQDVNAMVDALNLFVETIHHETFLKTPVILFLNKKDLFENKIKDVPITECPMFSDFGERNDDNSAYINNNANDYVQSVYYVENKFKNVNKVNKRPIFSHITCAMDDENIKNVFVDVANIVLKNLADGYVF